MDWEIVLVFIGFVIYLGYNLASLPLFKVPKSLSMTYYLYKERKEWQKLLFPIMMIFMGISLLPAWLEISEGSNLQFMVFLAILGILFTGSAPAFNNSSVENKVHMTSAILAAIFALLWIILVANLWYVIIVWFVVMLLIALLTNSVKTSYIYWLETIAFISTFTAIIAYYLV